MLSFDSWAMLRVLSPGTGTGAHKYCVLFARGNQSEKGAFKPRVNLKGQDLHTVLQTVDFCLTASSGVHHWTEHNRSPLRWVHIVFLSFTPFFSLTPLHSHIRHTINNSHQLHHQFLLNWSHLTWWFDAAGILGLQVRVLKQKLNSGMNNTVWHECCASMWSET